jgi:hypothetical protein
VCVCVCVCVDDNNNVFKLYYYSQFRVAIEVVIVEHKFNYVK